MTGKVLHIANTQVDSVFAQQEEFKSDVLSGLSNINKQIPSKYFYDERGSQIFNQITRHPDYYLTECEIEILQNHKKTLSSMLQEQPCNLIELGPGEGLKTQILLTQFLQDALQFTYSPIDISQEYLVNIVKQLNVQYPAIETIAVHADFFDGLEWLSMTSARRNVVLFLGSSIGNFDLKSTGEFLKHLWSVLHNNDLVLIGFDLRKDINILLRAYNDSDGLTRDFNFNLLMRINRELEANFDTNKFCHYAPYNVYTGAMESYLMSREPQTVAIGALGKSFQLGAYEPIHVEFSQKYLLSQIEQLANEAQFEIVQNFVDAQEYFVDSLWRVRKN